MYEYNQYDDEMYAENTESLKSWMLYSERALDTLCLCGIRHRLSQGSLDAVRYYHALDGSSVTLYRAVVDDVVEDITQSDLDIMRAIVTDYAFKHNYKAEYASLPWCEDEEVLFTITPTKIRSLLCLSRYDLPTERITRSLKRLASLVVQGKYRVRTGVKAEEYPINDALFELAVDLSNSGKRVQEYILYFGSEWGRAFLHNVRCGNFIVVRDIPYHSMSAGAKQLFYISMIMPREKLIRHRNGFLQLMNIKERQNAPRSIKRFESYLEQLADMKLIKWRYDSGKYNIQRLYSPIKGVRLEAILSVNEQIPVKELEQEQNEAWEVQFERVLNKLSHKNLRSDYENIQYQMYQDVIKLQERIEEMNNSEYKNIYKQTILRKHWESFSPYYLWTQQEFRQWFRNEINQAKYNPNYIRFEKIFDEIENNQKLQNNVLEWAEAVEDYFSRLI